MHDDDVRLPPIPLPGYEARAQARAIFGLTGLVLGLAAFLFLAAPGGMGGTSTEDVRIDRIAVAVLLVGFGMLLVGLAWMAWIYRSAFNGEPDPEHWRYRDR